MPFLESQALTIVTTRCTVKYLTVQYSTANDICQHVAVIERERWGETCKQKDRYIEKKK
jgi:hypothetical protein